MDAQTQSGAPVGAQRRRVHHTYIWLGGLGAAFWLVVALAVGGAGIVGELLEDGDLSPVALGAFAGFGMMALVAVVVVAVGAGIGLRAISYRHLWYELDPTELGVYSGVISKKRTHVPYQKIQSVDLKATLVQRVLGVCNVVIDTAGGATNKAIVIPYLSRQDAQTLKGELYALKNACAASASTSPQAPGFAPPTGQPVAVAASAVPGNVLDVGSEAWEQFGGVFAGQAPVAEAASYEYGLTNKEILLTGVSNSGGVVAGLVSALIAGAASIVPLVSSIARNVPGAHDAASALVTQAAFDRALQAVLPLLIGGFVVVALVVWAIAALSACLQYGGFKARRRGTRIEVERGLLQHNAVSLDVERVQSVIIRQSLVRRLIGYCEVSLGKVDAAEPGSSQSNANNKSLSDSGFVIHPFVKADQVDDVLRGMIPEYAAVPTSEERLAPVALRRGLVRRCILCGGGFWLALLAAATQVVLHVAFGEPADEPTLLAVDTVAVAAYVIAAIVFVLDVVGTILWFRDSRFGLARGMVFLTNGGLSKATVSIPRTKVQFGATKSNPLQRAAGTATIAATTAAGVGGTQTALIDVSAATAAAWLSWVQPRRAHASEVEPSL